MPRSFVPDVFRFPNCYFFPTKHFAANRSRPALSVSCMVVKLTLVLVWTFPSRKVTLGNYLRNLNNQCCWPSSHFSRFFPRQMSLILGPCEFEYPQTDARILLVWTRTSLSQVTSNDRLKVGTFNICNQFCQRQTLCLTSRNKRQTLDNILNDKCHLKFKGRPAISTEPFSLSQKALFISQGESRFFSLTLVRWKWQLSRLFVFLFLG